MGTRREEPYGPLVARIEQNTELPLLILALVYVVAFMAGYVPRVPEDVRSIAEFAEYTVIALFAVDLVVKVAVAERRFAYLRAHWIDVIIVLLPFLRPFFFLRVLRILPFLARGLMALRRIMGPYRGVYVLLVGLLAVLGSAALVAMFESDVEGSIKDFGDALWWAVATVTTVGYGDKTPVTPEGRAVAVFLMLVGIALFGILTASVAAYFVESAEHAEHDQNHLERQELMDRIGALEARIEQQNRLLVALVRDRVPEKQGAATDDAAGAE